MSLFKTVSLKCPSCGAPQAFDAVHSLNADRRPDLRAQVLDGSFQSKACGKCEAEFRLEPSFNYIDHGRGQWIDAAPLGALLDWAGEEGRAQALFDDAYGPEASDDAKALGAAMTRRVTFGWAALREKLLAADQRLDDLTLELVKTAILRSGLPAELDKDTDLRLLDAGPKALVFGWQDAATGAVGATLEVARGLYDQIDADDAGAWAELRASIGAGLYVDVARLYRVNPAPRA